ncbi:hypothetical protein TSAR_013545 [Trichomalopsis sarcophagae]|uniref:Homeobox domain-containing protein n=1 Tax=Trichomalopsis sarcophagae TaxID=543379 RepID=A0A232FIG2_9HYME|nr:hypothetical protein TSAR_013545 [Trichomalopsis sarcophagae]
MSEPAQGAQRRATSDFSIERILSKDVPSSSSSSSSASTATVGPAQSTYPSFALQNRLEWLRSFCKLRTPGEPRPSGDAATAGVLAIDNQPSKQPNKSDSTQLNSEELSWLRCTRYRPPKLPRKSSAGKIFKRKPGSHPRIPFTKYQIEILENRYRSSSYLSRDDVVNLSDLLHLPQSRIKIWFQNRRARERRESQTTEQMETTIS